MLCLHASVCAQPPTDKQQALQYVNIKGAWLFGPSAIKMYVRSSSGVNVKAKNEIPCKCVGRTNITTATSAEKQQQRSRVWAKERLL